MDADAIAEVSPDTRALSSSCAEQSDPPAVGAMISKLDDNFH